MSVYGTYDVTLNSPMGAQQMKLTLEEKEGGLGGSMAAPQGSMDIESGSVDGDKVSWQVSITQPMALTMEFSATVDGDKISGEAKLGSFGTAPFSGTRV